MAKPRIGITIGDPSGIGPEIVIKSLLDKEISRICNPVIIGSKIILESHYRKLWAQIKSVSIFDMPLLSKNSIVLGKMSADSGKLAYQYIAKGVELVTSGKIDALATAPVSKEAIQKAGYNFYGHTELLAELTKSKNVAMCMLNKEIKTVQVTRHIAFADVPRKITKNSLVTTIQLGHKMMCELFKIRNPKIVVCALNPHAGENGIFGNEEQNVIIPALKSISKQGINVVGPYPADIVFHPKTRKQYDLIVGLYHDQVMIPLKAINPDTIVNLTVGLPFIRTSPGHGTAFDIAGKNIANPQPMKEAIKLTAKICL